MWTSIIAIIAGIVTLLVWWTTGQAARHKKATWDKFNAVEAAYRQALAEGDPVKAADLAKQMDEMRKEYKFLGDLP